MVHYGHEAGGRTTSDMGFPVTRESPVGYAGESVGDAETR
jgi:hypothetical protein